jgi:hypothetical protein
MGFDAKDCAAQQLGFKLQLANQTYDSFYINSNGVLSLGSIEAQLLSSISDPSESLGEYSVPVFSPWFRDGFGSSQNYDGFFVSQVVSSTSDMLKVAFFECSDSTRCGLESVRRGLGQNPPSFYVTLARLDGGGFSLNYMYDEPLLGTVGTYGFNLPSTGLLETTGPLQNRNFTFDGSGQLLAAAVPEPATWLSMLLGFGVIGTAMRRRPTKVGGQPA